MNYTISEIFIAGLIENTSQQSGSVMRDQQEKREHYCPEQTEYTASTSWLRGGVMETHGLCFTASLHIGKGHTG